MTTKCDPVTHVHEYDSVSDWRYGDTLFIKKLREANLSDEQILFVIDAIESTCNLCWDGNGTECNDD